MEEAYLCTWAKLIGGIDIRVGILDICKSTSFYHVGCTVLKVVIKL